MSILDLDFDEHCRCSQLYARSFARLANRRLFAFEDVDVLHAAKSIWTCDVEMPKAILDDVVVRAT